MTAFSSLEVLRYAPRGAARRTPLLFVHGAYVGAWCWDEHFLPYFVEHGYAVHALSLRGHGASAGRESLDLAGIDDYVADMLSVARTVKPPPILVGHSMGAIVAQRALRRSRTPAAVLMNPVPITGLAWSAMLLAQRDPEMFHDVNLMQHVHPRGAPFRSLRRALFSDKVADGHVVRHLERMQAESERALFDLSWPQSVFFETADIPLLALGAGDDALFPPWMITSSASAYGATAEIIPGMAHAMMLEPDWRTAADRILEWLEAQGF